LAKAVRRVCFIRAIGPATHKVMGLADLCEAFAVQGLSDAKSVLNTGNLFFTSSASAKSCKAKAAAAIKSFGLELDVFLRDLDEMTAAVKANPYPKAVEARPHHMVAIFFDDVLSPALVTTLEQHKGPEQVKVIGNTVYVDYLDGIGTSKFAPGVIERRLKAKGTARNWNTILKSLALLQS